MGIKIDRFNCLIFFFQFWFKRPIKCFSFILRAEANQSAFYKVAEL